MGADPVVIVMSTAAIAVLTAKTRFAAAVLVGVTGYGMSVLFVLHGAVDLALTQLVVETVTLIAFVLVLRRLPRGSRRRTRRVSGWSGRSSPGSPG
ncbi:DUF4040 domain-containing protein [Curtobacterium flaccumfaciens]|nr:DUF4040 domain-containing protein [Curtobacterium flaccumfaciens]